MTKHRHFVPTDYPHLALLQHKTIPNLISPQPPVTSPPHLQCTKVNLKCCSPTSQFLSTSLKSGFHSSSRRHHQSSEKTLFRHRSVQVEGQNCQRLSLFCLKTHQKPPKRAGTKIFANTVFPVVWYCAPALSFATFKRFFCFILQ